VSSWHSYASIYALGHRYIADLLSGPVNVEEKIDGSQFSFGAFDVVEPARPEDGYQREIRVRSKGCVLNIDAPEKMFSEAVASVLERAELLHEGWTYRAEYLKKPKHNGLAYDRIPRGHLIVFDINVDQENYLPYADKAAEAARIGLECVPLLDSGLLTSVEQFRRYLDTTSVLGGQKIEGVVVKPSAYNLFGLDKKCLMGKFVSEAYKEVQAKAWKESNPHQNDILQRLGDTYTTQARWMKAVQHLREAGSLDGSPKDIGALIKAVPVDVRKECEDEIKAALFEWAWPNISRMTTRGLPDWYKQELLKQQFEAQP
jgi:hypothetical protein